VKVTMLESALKFMIDRCEREIATNPRALYYAHLKSESCKQEEKLITTLRIVLF